MAVNPKSRSDLSDTAERSGNQADLSASAYDRVLHALGSSRDFAWLSRETGISTSTLGELKSGRIPRADRAIRIANALGTSVEYLFGGGAKRDTTHLVDAGAADWVSLPRYDLRELSEIGKGEPIETTPIRRDWLYRRLLVSSGLWLTEVTTDYEHLHLTEGDVVICSDIPAGVDPVDGWTCIFRGDGGPFISTYRASVSASGGRLPPDDDFLIAGRAVNFRFVTAYDLEEGWVHAVARIHAKFFAKL